MRFDWIKAIRCVCVRCSVRFRRIREFRRNINLCCRICQPDPLCIHPPNIRAIRPPLHDEGFFIYALDVPRTRRHRIGLKNFLFAISFLTIQSFAVYKIWTFSTQITMRVGDAWNVRTTVKFLGVFDRQNTWNWSPTGTQSATMWKMQNTRNKVASSSARQSAKRIEMSAPVPDG